MENAPNRNVPIKNWQADDRPREKMQLKGASALSDSELLAILVNTGNKQMSALDIAKEILKLGKNNLNELGKLSIKQLQQLKGIGPAKAITIAAALELGRRRQSSELLVKTVVRSSAEIAQYLQAMLKDYRHEVFAVVFLNRANKIISMETVSYTHLDVYKRQHQTRAKGWSILRRRMRAAKFLLASSRVVSPLATDIIVRKGLSL